MVIKRYIKGIAFALILSSAILMAMAAPASITNLQNTTFAPNHINWTWTDPADLNFTKVQVYLNGTFQTNVSKGVQFFSATGLIPDTLYTISTQTIDDNSSVNQTWVNQTARTAPLPDTTPPASITNLQNTTFAPDHINWTWNDPADADFSKAMIFLNGTFQTNVSKGVQFFSATGLIPDTLYTITTQTVDISGNINSTLVNHTSKTAPPDTSPPANITTLSNTSGSTWIKWTWANPPVDFDHTEVYLNDSFVLNTTSNNYNTSTNFTLGVKTVHNISLRPVDAAGNIGNWTNGSASTIAPPPRITRISPVESSFETIGIDTKIFTIRVEDQIANVTWAGAVSQQNLSIPVGGLVNVTFTPSLVGSYNITVTANNENGTSNLVFWNWTVHPRTFFTGNRVWDSTKDMSLIYTWNPMSFYAFYYDVDSNVGNESLTIHLDFPLDRNIQRGSLQYSTTPDSVSFQQSKWGRYSVIGFMADKYFAGYTSDTSKDLAGNPVSPLNSNQLHKILMDDDKQGVISAGSTLTLKEGYVIKVKDVDATGRIVLLSLLKDGGEVDTQPVSQGGTYVYSKRVGTVVDLPIIAVRVENVFSGTETSVAFTKGIFQLSESFTSANTGNRYGVMEITAASASGITMENRDSITLSQGSTVDIMGDIKFIVADNGSVLRFAPMVKRSGTYEVRGTIVQPNDTNPFEWTPMNFEGFYYNLNDDVGTEKLSITRSGTGVSKENLIYTTTPQAVNYKFSKFGTFNVIGFMADKYFAGYIGCPTCITTKDVSTIGFQQLHKVLVDDDTQTPIYAGSTLTLNDGYVMKIKDVNIGAGTASVWLSLLKDGNEIFSDVKNEGEIFTYAPSKVGAINDLPILALRIDKIFRGKEATLAFIRGVFQISEKYTSVNQGDRFGIMEVSEVSVNQIQMTNPSSFTLSSGSTIDVMGNIKFKVADSSDVRFYPFIMANGSDVASNQLAIDAPASPMVRDTITITVTAGGVTPIENAEVSFDGNVIGTTNSTGNLDYILTRSGQHTLTATKLGYDKATRTIQVAEFRDIALKFELPAFIDQGIPVAIKVISNGTAIPGANVTFNGASIGLTDSSGILTYTFSVSGTHNLGASKQRYISVLREITVRAPFTEFKAIDINFTPSVVFTNQNYFVWANVTNVGTKNGTLPVSLSVNDTAVESKNVTLAPGAKQEVNFTRKMTLPPGNYTVEILGQKKIMEVKEAPFNIFLIGGILTALGAVVIYLSTTVKGKATLDLLTEKFNELIASGKK